MRCSCRAPGDMDPPVVVRGKLAPVRFFRNGRYPVFRRPCSIRLGTTAKLGLGLLGRLDGPFAGSPPV